MGREGAASLTDSHAASSPGPAREMPMRIAVLADIHGNLPALEAVLLDLSRRGVDLIVDLGDCASGPLWPAETMELLGELGALTVRGNHDRAVGSFEPELMGLSDRFAHDSLDSAALARLAELPATLEVAPGVLACHGTPDDDATYLLDEVEAGRLVQARRETIERRLGRVEAGLVLCAHSHRPDLVQLPSGVVIVNPGSVGCPAFDDPTPPAHVSEAGAPHARYAMIELDDEALEPVVGFYAVGYDHDAAARRAAANGRADWARALATGRMAD
jgi:predicted phosphodiesterase